MDFSEAPPATLTAQGNTGLYDALYATHVVLASYIMEGFCPVQLEDLLWMPITKDAGLLFSLSRSSVMPLESVSLEEKEVL